MNVGLLLEQKYSLYIDVADSSEHAPKERELIYNEIHKHLTRRYVYGH
jgi:hypothetical protein